MKVKITYEKTQHLTAEVDINDTELLEFFNNGGEHGYKTLDEAREGEGVIFDSIVEEFIEDIPVDQEHYWTKVNGPGSVYLENISVVKE